MGLRAKATAMEVINSMRSVFIAGAARESGNPLAHLGGPADSRATVEALCRFYAEGRLANTKARAVGLSYLGLGTGAADIRKTVQLLRRILPKGTMIFIANWEADDAAAAKAALATVQADGYAATLHEAVEMCLRAATGKPKRKARTRAAKPAAASTRAKKRRSPAPRKRQPASA